MTVGEERVDMDAAVFAIAAAAELSGMHPQTLRQYDRMGLVVPGRTRGGSRRYSLRHIQRLREVAQMSAEGMSLPAVARILELQEHVAQLHRQVEELQAQVRAEIENRPGARVFAAGTSGAVVPLRHGRRLRRSTEIVIWRPHRHDSGSSASGR